MAKKNDSDDGKGKVIPEVQEILDDEACPTCKDKKFVFNPGSGSSGGLMPCPVCSS